MPPGGFRLHGVCLQGGGAASMGGGLPPGEICPIPHYRHLVAATAAVGAHPTGMHSCMKICFLSTYRQTHGLFCIYDFTVNPNKHVSITILSLKYMGPNVEYCKYGGISVYDVTGHFQPQKFHWKIFPLERVSLLKSFSCVMICLTQQALYLRNLTSFSLSIPTLFTTK